MTKVLDRARDFGRKMASDGPPLALVVGVIVLIGAFSLGVAHPLIGAVIVAVGLIAGAAIDLLACRHDIRDEGPAAQGLWLRAGKAGGRR